jgi:hypothetical protein
VSWRASRGHNQQHFCLLGHISDLEKALRDYHDSGGIKWDITHCTWDDVFDELEAAQHEYERAADGRNPSAVLRKGLRWTGDKATGIQPWVELIPTSNGLSVLGAGLKLIFNVYSVAIYHQ